MHYAYMRATKLGIILIRATVIISVIVAYMTIYVMIINVYTYNMCVILGQTAWVNSISIPK